MTFRLALTGARALHAQPCSPAALAGLGASRFMDFDPDNPLAVEIQQEMAAAYFAACRKMVDSRLDRNDRLVTNQCHGSYHEPRNSLPGIAPQRWRPGPPWYGSRYQRNELLVGRLSDCGRCCRQPKNPLAG